jgi:ankyrin repeat protein
MAQAQAQQSAHCEQQNTIEDAFLKNDIERFKALAEKNPALLDSSVSLDDDRPLHILLHSADETNNNEDLILFILVTYPAAAMTPSSVGKTVKVHGKVKLTLPENSLPLQLAASNNAVSLKVLKRLVEIFPKALQMADAKGRYPLHNACYLLDNHVAKIRFLWERFPQAARKANLLGNLPLHIASYSSKTEAVEFLLRSYPEGADMANKQGYYPLNRAFSKKRPTAKLCRVLVNATNEQKAFQTTLKDNNRLPLHCLAWNRTCDLVTFRKVLQRYPAGSGEKDKDGNLPIHLAAITHEELVETENGTASRSNRRKVKLLQELVNVHPFGLAVPNLQGSLPLHMAVDAYNPRQDVVDLLVRNFTAGLQVADSMRCLPLHIAILKNGFTSATVFSLLVFSPFQLPWRNQDPRTWRKACFTSIS